MTRSFFLRTATNSAAADRCVLPANAAFPPRPATAPPGPESNAAFWHASLYLYRAIASSDWTAVFKPQYSCIQEGYAAHAAAHEHHPGDIVRTGTGAGPDNENKNDPFPYRTTTSLRKTKLSLLAYRPRLLLVIPHSTGEQRPNWSSGSEGPSDPSAFPFG